MNLPAAHTPSTTVSTVTPTRLMTAQESQQYATDLARSTLLSSYFQNNPANVMYAMELGRSYGMEPVAVLANIHVFDDGQGRAKAALSADFMVSLARREGHIVHVEFDARSNKAIGTLIRRELLEMDTEKLRIFKELGVDLAAAYTFREVWTEEKAQAAGLMNKSNWKKYFGDMMKARVKAAVVRAGASEALIQLSNASALAGNLNIGGQQISLVTTHTADELGAEMTDDGERVVLTREDQLAFQRGPQQTMQKQAPQPQQTSQNDDPITAFIREKTAIQIVDWVKEAVVNNGDLNTKEKAERLMQVHKACKALGRLGAPVGADDGSPSNLDSIIKGLVQPLLSV